MIDLKVGQTVWCVYIGNFTSLNIEIFRGEVQESEGYPGTLVIVEDNLEINLDQNKIFYTKVEAVEYCINYLGVYKHEGN